MTLDVFALQVLPAEEMGAGIRRTVTTTCPFWTCLYTTCGPQQTVG